MYYEVIESEGLEPQSASIVSFIRGVPYQRSREHPFPPSLILQFPFLPLVLPPSFLLPDNSRGLGLRESHCALNLKMNSFSLPINTCSTTNTLITHRCRKLHKIVKISMSALDVNIIVLRIHKLKCQVQHCSIPVYHHVLVGGVLSASI